MMTMIPYRTAMSTRPYDTFADNFFRSFFGDEVFETLIPRTVKLSEAPSYGQSILEYAPDNKGALAYNDLAVVLLCELRNDRSDHAARTAPCSPKVNYQWQIASSVLFDVLCCDCYFHSCIRFFVSDYSLINDNAMQR